MKIDQIKPPFFPLILQKTLLIVMWFILLKSTPAHQSGAPNTREAQVEPLKKPKQAHQSKAPQKPSAAHHRGSADPVHSVSVSGDETLGYLEIGSYM